MFSVDEIENLLNELSSISGATKQMKVEMDFISPNFRPQQTVKLLFVVSQEKQAISECHSHNQRL